MEKLSWKERWKKVFNRKNFTGFAEKYGFSLLLLLCLCIIGATAFLTHGRLGKTPWNIRKKPEVVQEEPTKSPDLSKGDIVDLTGGKNTEKGENRTAAPSEQPVANRTVPEKKPAAPNVPAETKQENAKTVPVSAQNNADSKKMGAPVAGEMIRNYSMDELVFSSTLKEWTTHSGVDIAGTVGTEVKAALPGTVESIGEDPLKGIVITLSHGDGLQTVYMGLSAGDMVQEGQKVEKGQVISGIGRTAAFEITDDPHLHFEVLQNGEHQDPMEYLPGK